MKPNLLDRLVAAVSPAAGLRRAHARHRLQLASQMQPSAYYDGAGRGPRLDGWRVSHAGPRAEIAPAAAALRARARDLVRNNAYAERGVRALVANCIGTGLIPKIETPSKRLKARLDDAASRWMDTVKCDADGLHDLYGLQALAWRATVEGGEAFIRRRPRTANFARSHGAPLQLQVLEAEFLDRTKTGDTLSGDGRTIDGIEYDRYGRRLAYWLFDSHPLDGVFAGSVSRRVDADDVIHLYRVDRPGQQSGVTWFAPVVVRFRDFSDYQDAQLVRQKVAACFAVFEINADETTPGLISSDAAQETNLESLSPGLYERLPPGRDIKFASPPPADDQGYVADQLRAISAGLGVPYEVLTNDLSNVNFSSGRMGWLEFQRAISQYQQQLIIPRMLDRIGAWFVEGWGLYNSAATDRVRVTWTPPRREMIDPSREVKPLREMFDLRMTSLSEIIRQTGRDPEAVFAEIAEEREVLERLGIVIGGDAQPAVANPAAAADSDAEEDLING